MTRCARSLLSLLPLLLVPLATAQAPDEQLPVKDWICGGPVRFTGAAPAKLVMLVFLPQAESLPSASEALAQLQRDGQKGGLRVVAVLPDAPAAAPKPEPAFAIARGVDAPQQGPPSRLPAQVWLFDGEAVRWRGGLANGPGTVAAGILDGRLGEEQLQRLAELQGSLLAVDDFGFEYGDGNDLLKGADELLELDRGDGVAWALRYCTALNKLDDAALAQKTLQDGLAALAGDPHALAAFADLVLRSDPFTPGLGDAIWPPLSQAVPMAPALPLLQLTTLRALVRAGKDRQVGRLGQQLQKQLEDDGWALLQLAEILAGDRTPQVHRDAAERALQRAEQLGTGAGDGYLPETEAVRYKVTLRCAGDAAAAKAIADRLTERFGGGSGLNNVAWYTLTRTASRGRYDELGIEFCRRMLEQREQLQGFQLDTAALGMFLAGEVDKAVELQQAAVQSGDGQTDQYRERLQRFEAAAKRR